MQEFSRGYLFRSKDCNNNQDCADSTERNSRRRADPVERARQLKVNDLPLTVERRNTYFSKTNLFHEHQPAYSAKYLRQPPASKFRKFCKAIRMKCAFAACSLLLIISSIACGQSTNQTLIVGDTIPAFTLPDQDGRLFNSSDHLGKSDLVIFFYPKDESMVCTKEACSFRDRYADLIKAGAVVIGINGGSVTSHKAFQTHDNLPYPLLSDSANRVLTAFGIPRQFFMTGRKTFVVDKTGKIVFTYSSAIKGTRHAEEALAYLQKHPDR